MANEIKEGLFYSAEHEWVRVDGNKAYVGITDYAQHHLGDIVFIELPEVDSSFDAMSNIGVIESVKAVSDMHTPISGKVVDINNELEDTPELLNKEPYAHHLVVLEMSDRCELDKLMNSKSYTDFCEKAKD